MDTEVIDEAINSNEISRQLNDIAANDVERRAYLANDLRAALIAAWADLERAVGVQNDNAERARAALNDARFSYMLEHYAGFRQLNELYQRKRAEEEEARQRVNQQRTDNLERRAQLFAQRVGSKQQKDQVERRSFLSRFRSSSASRYGDLELEELDYAYERQLEDLQKLRRTIADIYNEMRRFHRLVQAAPARDDPVLARLAESERVARKEHRMALIENSILHAQTWIDEYVANEQVAESGTVTHEKMETNMVESEEQAKASSLATVRDEPLAAAAGAPGPGDQRSVFLVHGRDMRTVEAMRDLLRALGLRVVEWERAVESTGQASPFTGDVVLAGMRVADAVLVLFTPDDMVQLRPDLLRDGDARDEQELRGQARPNVFYEAGIADALDRSRTLLVEIGRVKSPSDLSGRNFVRFDGGAQARNRLVARLRSAGLIVDRSSEDWLRAGNFEPLIREAKEVLSRKMSAEEI